ncbi:pilus assembly protein [Colwellia sp. C1TZA3]|uniref:pilus assembly protein n=1 Tax=Colwellia sp. C1TZA3 TaxID=2508879 RepID=UPI0011BA155E|nr:PilC/PilY family type IV pilus protein [Colwellia sp. C1TZA3]TWX66552.1 rRNA (guanine-N1)-methyltransferase [Colwellia sp. C1TZA3]
MKRFFAISLLVLTSTLSYSEDIELYVNETVKVAASKTQVLIILDDSGSMNTEETVKIRYNPAEDYPAIPEREKFSSEHLYYNKGDEIPKPDTSSEKRRFLASLNGCSSAKSSLANNGFYTTHIRQYQFTDNTGQWENLSDNNGSNISVLDCEDDVLNSNTNNADGFEPGFPANSLGDKNNPEYFTDDIDSSDVVWSGKLVTLYTENYLRWYYGNNTQEEQRSRMEMAKESINDVITSAPSIDFGLQVFNFNYGDNSNSGNGGRIVAGIKELTDNNRNKLLNMVNNEIVANGSTPLCETLYEASRYFSGAEVYYGDDDINVDSYNYTKNTPPRDLSIESSSQYISPFSSCSDKIYVILITDGQPQFDHHADSRVEALSAVEDGTTFNFTGSKFEGNYLAGLAEWMSNRDLNTELTGKQTADIYTIGFSAGADDAAPLLKETADLGGGKYFRATDSAQLTAALVGALEDLEPSNDSLTSASVAANNFDRTETLNSVYYAMFQPENGPRWQGNLKKYKVVSSNQVGKHGNSALDLNSGQFSKDVTSFWSADNAKDGAVVTKGGVAEMLRNKTNRSVYSDIGSGDALALLTQTQAETSFGGSAELATALDVNEDEVGTYLRWARGENVDNIKLADDSIPTMRPDIFGDPLHSKPLVVNYGDSIRIIIGTNAGALHMFEDKGDSVDESWAFMPKEFFKNIKPLRENYSTAGKVYGVDGNITSYVKDENGDGVINGTDKVWIFFGLRRGGTSYYALDISDPNSPSKLWHIDASTTGFGRLGQSWSQPKLGYSKLNILGSGNSAVAAPVLFFGGGYDVVNDSKTPTDADVQGNAVYMTDAKTGELKWSMAPAGSGGDTVFAGKDSIPSSIAILDSDGDGLIDRLYTGDTGGNVWRVDMPSADPADSDDPWTVFKLAELGGITNSTDLRFFNEPSIVRTFISETIQTIEKDEDDNDVTITSHQEKPYDAVLIGSGDRSNPLGTDTDDTFFMIKDQEIKTKSFYSAIEPKAPTALLRANLYDYTNNPFAQTLTTIERNELARDVSKKSGWFINLKGSGEKSTAEAIVINGVVFFTTFIPPNLDPNVVYCEQPNGTGLLYAVDLALGTAVYNWQKNDDVPTDDVPPDDAVRSVKVSEQFLGAPTLIVVPDANGDTIGNIIVGREVVITPFKLQTMRTYLYIKEGP